MDPKQPPPATIDEYIAGFPPDVQAILQKIRAAIHAAAPHATEKISYQMPTFYLNGNLVHFAAFAHHIGFYPAPTGIASFRTGSRAEARQRLGPVPAGQADPLRPDP